MSKYVYEEFNCTELRVKVGISKGLEEKIRTEREREREEGRIP